MEIKVNRLSPKLPSQHSSSHKWSDREFSAALHGVLMRLCKVQAPDQAEPAICPTAAGALVLALMGLLKVQYGSGDANTARRLYGATAAEIGRQAGLLADLVRLRENAPPVEPAPVKTIKREKDGTFTVREVPAAAPAEKRIGFGGK